MNRKITFCLIAVIILAAVVMNLLAYPKLPERMACHWGPGGQVDNWMDKDICIWIMPGISVGLTALFFVILLIDPLRKNIEKFFSYYAGFVIIMNLFLLAVHGWMLLWNLGIQVPVNVFIPIGMGCLIFYLGIVTSHVKPNWFIGIRTPWTLSNEIVWQKTHKLGGVLFRIAAIIILIGALFPQYAILFVLVPVLSVAIITTLYSLWLAMRAKGPSKKHLSMFLIMLLLVCLGAAIVPLIHSMHFSTPAFADAVEPLLNAKTISLQISGSMRMGDSETTLPTMYCTYQEPYRVRITMPEINSIIILDTKTGKMLSLCPKDKIAMIGEVTSHTNTFDDFDPQELYTAFFNIRDAILQAKKEEITETLPETDMDGRKVIGYRFSEANDETTLWIDKKTFQPFQIQSIMKIGSGLKLTNNMTILDIDKEYASNLFSMDIPAGYATVKTPIDLSLSEKTPLPDEKSLIETFRLCVQYSDGKFPSDLTLECMKEFIQTSLKHPPDSTEFESKIDIILDQPEKFVSGIVFAQMLPEESDWHYAGKDAVFGDSSTPIFWYRPENTSAYRVIYADLSIKGVTADQLPTDVK
jgi:uncharacterized membrane protein/outer membrane lipoprotein-sorting protein